MWSLLGWMGAVAFVGGCFLLFLNWLYDRIGP